MKDKPRKANPNIRILASIRSNSKINVRITLNDMDPEEVAGLAKRLAHGYGKGISLQREIGYKLERQVVDLYLQEGRK